MTKLVCLLIILIRACRSFLSPDLIANMKTNINGLQATISSSSSNGNGNESNNEAERLRLKALKLRDQISRLEKEITPDMIGNNNAQYISEQTIPELHKDDKSRTLRNKSVLVIGANGRLGSMVTRYLLRNHPEVQKVIASVHYVGQRSSRGYGRLSYEVGAEDGIGSIGPAWSEDRDAYFEYSEKMEDYNLNKLRVVELELLDPNQCRAIVEGVDCIIYCATDFDGNRPNAIANLNVAFLFRAIASPTKGRVDIEGLTNILGALKESSMNKIRVARMEGDNIERTKQEKIEIPNFVLVSSAPNVFGNFETPFGEYDSIKRQAEGILKNDFPSVTYAVLQFGRYDDIFVEESLRLNYDFGNDSKQEESSSRRINRRDAARATVGALTNETLTDQTVQIWTKD